VTAVLGPGATGVVVTTPDPEAARRDRVWLEDATIPAATPADLGLAWADRPRSEGMAGGEPPHDPSGSARGWAAAVRRPTVSSDGDVAWVCAPGEAAVAAERDEGLEAVEAAAGRPVAPRVAVFGGAWTDEGEPDYVSARALGRGLAEGGLEIVCGGYQGIMAAVCRGHTERHLGVTLGVTMGPWVERVAVNEWLTHEVVARDLFARLPLITDAEAWVAFPGGVGTLQEVALCWNLVQNGLADPRPLVVVGDRWERLEAILREILIVSDPAHFELVTHVSTAEEALVIVRKALA
jgi:uncharacterized protein (TIGR00730 family)